jgi:NADPH2:quinone reductase
VENCSSSSKIPIQLSRPFSFTIATEEIAIGNTFATKFSKFRATAGDTFESPLMIQEFPSPLSIKEQMLRGAYFYRLFARNCPQKAITMKAIELKENGGPEVMRLREIPMPKPQQGEALIRVAVTGVNFIDLYVREGRYCNKLPFTPGQEAAGTVVAVGTGVSHLHEGDRVAWCSILGTYAEYAVAPAERVVPIPVGIAFEQAAAALLQGMTAHYLSHSAYPIQPGDEVLIHAGAGGTGLLLTQLAKQRGARVLTTVSNEEKAELSYQVGADVVILYTRFDFGAEVKRLTDGRGLAAVYDSIGKETVEESLTCLKARGTLVLYGSASGDVPPLDLMKLASLGSLYVTRPILRDYTLTRNELVDRATQVFQAVVSGLLKLRIERTYSLSEAAQAHRDLESRKTTGKLLLFP